MKTQFASYWSEAPAYRRAARRQGGVFRLNLWLPLTPLWVLLAPFAFLTLPIVAFLTLPNRVNPVGVLTTVGGVLLAMGGSDVTVETPRALVRIRIF